MKMKISVDDDGAIVISEVFSGAYLETTEGNRIGFCMRDDTIEFSVLPKDSKEECRWFRVNMQTREVEDMSTNHPRCCSAVQDPAGGGEGCAPV